MVSIYGPKILDMWDARDIYHDNCGLQEPSSDGATYASEYAKTL